MKVFKTKACLGIAVAGLMVLALGDAEASRRRPSKPPESAVDRYQRSWEHKALKIQEQLQRHNPLRLATFIHTHNSYNSKA